MKNLAISFVVLTIVAVIAAFFIPINAAVVAIASSLWVFIIASIVLFCVSILLLFILTGIGLLIFSLLPLIWGVVAIIFFPFLLPIIVPLALTYAFILIVRKRAEAKKLKNDIS